MTGAPLVLHSTLEVRRTAADVAAFVLNWANDVTWRSQVQGFVVEPPGQAVAGQTLVEELRFAGITFRTPTVIDSAHAYRAAYSGGTRSVRVVGWRQITPTSPISCTVELWTGIKLVGALGLLEPVLASSYRKADAADAARLAALLRDTPRLPRP